MEKTAVEWFAKEIIDAIQHGDKDFVYWKLKTSLLEEAKEMEKQQIINAYDLGRLSDMHYPNPETIIENGEQYYNETFKSE